MVLVHFCSTTFWMPSRPGALYSFSCHIVAQISAQVKVLYGLRGSG